MSSILMGSLFGLTVQLMSNSMRKLPLSRHPWEHLAFIVGGGLVGYKASGFDAYYQKKLDDFQAKHPEIPAEVFKVGLPTAAELAELARSKSK
eukprot:CAMPEP_0174893378 /NCGR_PEP_ID=MMETSP0167-20121228/8206_1 /TAXON_ID=38298 /ORGANISM="Rhodella maculata, Strain CCMP736" /LENGTH=92 /DNA_ID=CAMNT_0016132149 /DNA_START=90 /DNA_END=368 /DNA_ORIENTATION=+